MTHIRNVLVPSPLFFSDFPIRPLSLSLDHFPDPRLTETKPGKWGRGHPINLIYVISADGRSRIDESPLSEPEPVCVCVCVWKERKEKRRKAKAHRKGWY